MGKAEIAAWIEEKTPSDWEKLSQTTRSLFLGVGMPERNLDTLIRAGLLPFTQDEAEDVMMALLDDGINPENRKKLYAILSGRPELIHQENWPVRPHQKSSSL